MTTAAQTQIFFDIAGREFSRDRLDAAIAAFEDAKARALRFSFTFCRCSESQLHHVGCDCEVSHRPEADDAAIAELTALARRFVKTPICVLDLGPDFAARGHHSRFTAKTLPRAIELERAEIIHTNAAGWQARIDAKHAAESAMLEALDAVDAASVCTR